MFKPGSRYRRPSNRERGLREIMNDPAWIAEHNGKGYDDFVQAIEAGKKPADLMFEFNIRTYKTVNKHLAQYRDEKRERDDTIEA